MTKVPRHGSSMIGDAGWAHGMGAWVSVATDWLDQA
jgi:hypothetical protein